MLTSSQGSRLHAPTRRQSLVAIALAVSPCLVQSDPTALDLRATVERLAQKHKVCNVAFATVSARAVAEVGTASGCDSAPPPGKDAIFQAASLSKPVFAYGVLKLVEQGKLDLDTPLVKHLPGGYLHRQNPFDNNRPPATDAVVAPELNAVSARLVLSHTSGLPNWSPGRLSFDFQPGSAWQYSGEGFMLLQRVVEAVTSEPLDEFMRRQVFEPLGMASSDFRWKSSFAGRIVPGTSWWGLPRQLRFSEPLAPASLYTTAGDYARFLSALLADAPTLRLITTAPATVNTKLGLDWGLGWGIERGERGQHLWQWGNNPGYRAFVMVSASSGDGVVILTDSERGMALAEPMARAVLPGDHPAFQFHMLR
jgi:CubicO group peptidase (beta-lactamase class C family)